MLSYFTPGGLGVTAFLPLQRKLPIRSAIDRVYLAFYNVLIIPVGWSSVGLRGDPRGRP